MEITLPFTVGAFTWSDTFQVTWTADPSLNHGQFAVWVRSSQGDWYWMSPLIAATGKTQYSHTINLAGLPAGAGYQVIVAYEPIANTSLWVSWATSSGVFSVETVVPEITISAPVGTASYLQTEQVTVNWTTNQDLTTGEFALWVRSADGAGWYATALIPAAGAQGSLYTTNLPLTGVPLGAGYQVILAYRPVVDAGDFMSWATSPGSFAVVDEPSS